MDSEQANFHDVCAARLMLFLNYILSCLVCENRPQQSSIPGGLLDCHRSDDGFPVHSGTKAAEWLHQIIIGPT